MFQKLLETHVDTLIEHAKKSDHSKLKVYDVLYKHIKSFVKTNALLMNSESNDSVCSFKIYGGYIFQYANMLANELAQFTSYIRLNTAVRNSEFVIVVDGVNMVYMINIDNNFMKIMTSAVNVNKHTLSPEVELIDIYHRLYSPNKCSEIKSTTQHESLLWKLFNDTRTSIVSRPVIKGGSEHVDLVLKWLVGQHGCVVIGDAASTLLSSKGIQHSNTVQFISANPKQAIEDLKKHMQRFVGMNVNIKKYDMNIPDDFRIRKFVLSAKINGSTYYIANVFNSAFYELIPYTSIDGINVATFAVILRFMFIDIWFLRMLRYFNNIDQKRYKYSMNTLYSNIDSIHSKWSNTMNEKTRTLPTYIGTYVNEVISKKNISGIPPYYPAKYKLDTGGYRVIGDVN
jgi:hypothetical protein